MNQKNQEDEYKDYLNNRNKIIFLSASKKTNKFDKLVGHQLKLNFINKDKKKNIINDHNSDHKKIKKTKKTRKI